MKVASSVQLFSVGPRQFQFNRLTKLLRKAAPWYRRASLLGPQEGFKNGFQNDAKLGVQFGVILAGLAALGHPKPSKMKPKTFKLEPKWCQDAVMTPKNRNNNF